jgi:hypothetical protein
MPAEGGKSANRSRLLQKFGKAKAVNPFAEEEKRATQNMAEGISQILDMHNSGELAALCGVMCLGTDGTNREKKERVLAHIARQTQISHNPEKSYSEVLHLMWEGILFEYLRANGMPMKTVEHDPRVFTILMWRKKAMEQFGGTFRPHYMPRHIRPRTMPEKLDEDLRALLNGVAAKEIFVKESEKRVKRDNDYRNVVMYLAAVTDMHNYEVRVKVFHSTVLKWTIYRALDFAFEFIDPHDGDRDFFLFATRKFTFSRSLTKNNF